MGLIRLFFLMVVLTGVSYLLVSIFSRSLRTEKLEKRWDAEQPEGIDRETYVAQGLKKYDSSFRRRLIALILIVPFVVVMIAVWAQNYTGYR